MHQKHFSAVKDISFYPTTIDFLNALPEVIFNNEAILLKGARIFEFEKISHVLEQKLHDTMLEINLNAIFI
jgi:alanine racemase